jgi:hypothetical protein
MIDIAHLFVFSVILMMMFHLSSAEGTRIKYPASSSQSSTHELCANVLKKVTFLHFVLSIPA